MSNAGNITAHQCGGAEQPERGHASSRPSPCCPAQTTNFTGSYLAPTNCSTTSTSTATGQSICGVAVTNFVTTTCPILTSPAIAVTVVCPTTPVYPGGVLDLHGFGQQFRQFHPDQRHRGQRPAGGRHDRSAPGHAGARRLRQLLGQLSRPRWTAAWCGAPSWPAARAVPASPSPTRTPPPASSPPARGWWSPKSATPASCNPAPPDLQRHRQQRRQHHADRRVTWWTARPRTTRRCRVPLIWRRASRWTSTAPMSCRRISAAATRSRRAA